MRIRRLLSLFLAAVVLLALLLGLANWQLMQRMDALAARLAQAQASVHKITTLLILTQEYALHGEERAAQQWKENLAALSGQTQGDGSAAAGPLARFPEHLHEQATALGRLFEQLEAASQSPETPLQLRRKRLLLDQMLIHVTTLSESLKHREATVRAEHKDLRRQMDSMSVMRLLVMLGVLAIFTWLLVRRVLQPLARLHATVSAVAQGKLSVHSASTAKDELGDLSRAFDALAIDMVTDLRKQVAERQQAEQHAHRVSHLYAVLSACNHAIVHSDSVDELFRKVCHATVTIGGMKMAWIGMIDAATQVLKPVASHGHECEHLAAARLSVDPLSPFWHCPAEIAAREGQPYWCVDCANDPLTAACPNIARSRCAALAALPLRCGGKTVGVFFVHAGAVDVVVDEVRKLLTEIATDIGFALDNFANQAERQRATLQLAESQSQRNTETSAALETQRQSARAALSLMEDALAARQQAESLSGTLNEQLDELRRWQQVTLNRERRILSLKKEINDLLAAHGQSPRYPSALDEGAQA